MGTCGCMQPTSPEEHAHVLRYVLPNDIFDVSTAPVDLKEVEVMLCNAGHVDAG